MFSDSLVTDLDWKRLGTFSDDGKLHCSFWTRADGQLGIQHLGAAAAVSYEPHTHSEYAVMVCLAGEIVQAQFDEIQTAAPGEALVSNFGVEHTGGYRTLNSRRCEAVILHFDRRLLTALAPALQLPETNGEICLAFSGKCGGEILRQCAQDIAQELKTRAAGHKMILETLAMRLLVETLRAWPREQIAVIAADPTPRLPRRDFVRAYEFMRRCRKETFRLQHLCQFLGSSEERFTRLFQATTRSTPASFYNRMLLQRGRELLRDPALSIKEISFQLGFKTSSHFIVAFRREFAASPQEYRSRLNQQLSALTFSVRPKTFGPPKLPEPALAAAA